MKIIKSLLLVAILPFASIQAQVISDSVIMGANYENDVFYSFGNVNPRVEANSLNYNLAFSNMVSMDDQFYTIWTNPSNTHVYVNPSQKISQWAEFDPTGSENWRKLENQDTSWGKGGFAVGKEVHPRYTWGEYKANGDIRGDSMYLVSIYNPVTEEFDIEYKLMLMRRLSNNNNRTWTFKIGKVDNSWDSTIVLNDLALSQGNFMYYDLLNKKEVTREPDTKKWDAVFTRYNTFTQGIYYTVTGVLTNYGVKTAILDGDINDTDLLARVNTGDDINTKINGIGYDWKYFDRMTNQFELEKNKVRIIYLPTSTAGINDIYALQFTGFGGAIDGKINFNYRKLGELAVANKTLEINTVSLYPNPANQQLNIKTTETFTAYKIYNFNGQLLAAGPLNNSTINLENLSAGMYQIQFTNGQGQIATSKFIKE